MKKNDYEYVAKRYTHCECCGSGENLELHHVLYHRSILHPELNVTQNLARVCKKCHESGKASTYDFQVDHWNRRVKDGYDMKAWNEELPLKVKERWE
jgi:hypothetical protein